MLIKIITSNDYNFMQRIGKLRADVWNEEGVSLPNICKNNMLLDELDHDEAKHFVVFKDDELIAAARLTLHHSLTEMPSAEDFAPYDLALELPYGYLSRLVVKKSFRNQGLARKLDCMCLHEAKKLGAKAVILTTVPYRLKALSKIGFSYFGLSGLLPEQMSDLQIETHIMAHYLEQLPPIDT